MLRIGQQKFGKAPTKKQKKSLDAVSQLDALETLAERVVVVDSWSELLEQ